MPRGDRTGPNGMGPMTGRGAGYCAGYAVPGYANGGYAGGGGYGRGGYGMGGGKGRGYRRMQYAPAQPMWGRGAYPPAYPVVDEKEALANQADYLEQQLKAVRDRLSSLEDDK